MGPIVLTVGTWVDFCTFFGVLVPGRVELTSGSPPYRQNSGSSRKGWFRSEISSLLR